MPRPLQVLAGDCCASLEAEALGRAFIRARGQLSLATSIDLQSSPSRRCHLFPLILYHPFDFLPFACCSRCVRDGFSIVAPTRH